MMEDTHIHIVHVEERWLALDIERAISWDSMRIFPQGAQLIIIEPENWFKKNDNKTKVFNCFQHTWSMHRVKF